ncbi:HAD family hydrolase [Bordetella genomosp. 11]|uniref:Haloacid dehalogenase n=1 Tax=Bordetella genomosp. 11 TaxID=1416808 RepID=A0A261UZC1_9BORD|nr:HAD family hydrolase [Bordetella genomosp. 11]OZI66941.1 haloacid dehalogenase [Bordetella genomosp. 11]
MRDEPLFLFDVDNTLFDNDRMNRDLDERLRDVLGEDAVRRYRQVYEKRRNESGYADYLGSLQDLRQPGANDAQLVQVSTFLMEYPFQRAVFPGALDALSSVGKAVILSDGDVVFQPHKIRAAGLWDAVDGRVLIHVHKERMLAQIAQAHPAPHYVMVDDKLRLLAAIKRAWGERVTTVFVRQGHYALNDEENASYPSADITLDRIGQLADADIPVRASPPRARDD